MLRAATENIHQRQHAHPGFAAVQDGSITRHSYRALLVRLYSFYLPLEAALQLKAERSVWLASDLDWLGTSDAERAAMKLCPSIPLHRSPAWGLGALYVIDGSTLGGRGLFRGLGHLCGPDAIEGRRFFHGRGGKTGPDWLALLARLRSVTTDQARAEITQGAIHTFTAFETWLAGWRGAVR